jgi:hypothetical protein
MKTYIILAVSYLTVTSAFELGRPKKKDPQTATDPKPVKLPLVILPFADNPSSLLPQLSASVPGVEETLLMQVDLSSNFTTLIDINCVQSLDGI